MLGRAAAAALRHGGGVAARSGRLPLPARPPVPQPLAEPWLLPAICGLAVPAAWGGRAAAARTAPGIATSSRGAPACRGFAAAGLRQGGGAGPRLAPRRRESTLAAPSTPSPTTGPTLGLAAGLPDTARRALAAWLGGCAAWTASMVVLGGLTRLTRSGLSMTDWKFTGERPPGNEQEWEAEFAKYRASPEYKRVNLGMSLEDFKFIYWMEWAHRAWGRGLGLAFALPLAGFVAAGWVTRPLGRRLGLLLALGGGQGLVGWWMVKSGLEEPKDRWEVPRVSPTRLAAHLASAFTIYGLLVYTCLQVAFPGPPPAVAGGAAAGALRALRVRAHPVAGLIALTAASGAFVAGLDAGRAFNTFPLMDGAVIPDAYWEEGGPAGAFTRTAPAQLHHRALALSTWSACLWLWASQRGAAGLPRSARAALAALPLLATCQASLGVATLLTHVPADLGAAHQAGALALLTSALALIFVVRRPRGAPSVLASAARAAGGASGGAGRAAVAAPAA